MAFKRPLESPQRNRAFKRANFLASISPGRRPPSSNISNHDRSEFNDDLDDFLSQMPIDQDRENGAKSHSQRPRCERGDRETKNVLLPKNENPDNRLSDMKCMFKKANNQEIKLSKDAEKTMIKLASELQLLDCLIDNPCDGSNNQDLDSKESCRYKNRLDGSLSSAASSTPPSSMSSPSSPERSVLNTSYDIIFNQEDDDFLSNLDVDSNVP